MRWRRWWRPSTARAARQSGKTAGELVGMPCDVVVSDDFAGQIGKADVLIDFTRPGDAGTPACLPQAGRGDDHRYYGIRGRWQGRHRRGSEGCAGGLCAQHGRRREPSFSSCSTPLRASLIRATTSRSSRRTTSTRSMHRPGRPCAWAKSRVGPRPGPRGMCGLRS